MISRISTYDQDQNVDQDIDVQTDQQHTLAPTRRQRRIIDNQENQNEEIRDFDEADDEKVPNWMIS